MLHLDHACQKSDNAENNAGDLNVVMSMYNLLEFSDNLHH